MKLTLTLLFFFCAIVFATVMQLGALYLFPYPFAKINVLFLLLLILLMVWESGWVVWLSFLAHFIVELFSLTPFGVVLFSATMSTLFALWMYRHVFTNRSWFTAVVLCVSTIALYRVLYGVLLTAAAVVDPTISLSVSALLVPFIWELFLTTITMGTAYLVLSVLSKRFHLTA